jgi:hypothetical protein
MLYELAQQWPSMRQPRKAPRKQSKPQQLVANGSDEAILHILSSSLSPRAFLEQTADSQLASKVCNWAELAVGDAYIGCRLRGREKTGKKKKQYFNDRSLRIWSQQKYNLPAAILSRSRQFVRFPSLLEWHCLRHKTLYPFRLDSS